MPFGSQSCEDPCVPAVCQPPVDRSPMPFGSQSCEDSDLAKQVQTLLDVTNAFRQSVL